MAAAYVAALLACTCPCPEILLLATQASMQGQLRGCVQNIDAEAQAGMSVRACCMRRSAYTERQRQKGTPCSYPQELLIFNNELDPFDPSHNESFWMSMEGELDVHALCLALRSLCERHTVLQSRFSISVRPFEPCPPTSALQPGTWELPPTLMLRPVPAWNMFRAEPRYTVSGSLLTCVPALPVHALSTSAQVLCVHAGSSCTAPAAPAPQVPPAHLLHRPGHGAGPAPATLSTGRLGAAQCDGSINVHRLHYRCISAPCCVWHAA